MIMLLCSIAAAAALRAPVLPATSSARSAVNMMAKKIPDKNVWVPIIPSSDAKPLSVTSGFQYGIEVAVVSDKGGNVYGLSNKLPPFGQPTTFATFDASKPDCIIEPVTGTAYNYKTGKVSGAWCPSPLGKIIFGLLTSPTDVQKVQVRKKGKAVEALINVNAKQQFESDYWRGVLDAQGKVDGGYY